MDSLRVNMSDSRINSSNQNSINGNDFRRKQSMLGSSLKVRNRRDKMIEDLMKQKQSLVDEKNKISDDAIKSGEDRNSVKNKMDAIDKQIKAIDDQITKLQSDEKQQAANKNNGVDKKGEAKKTQDSISKDKKEGESESLDQIAKIAVSMDGLAKEKELTSIKRTMKNKITTMNGEIKLDGGRGGSTKAEEAEVDRIQVSMNNMDDNTKNKVSRHKVNDVNNTSIQKSSSADETSDKDDKKSKAQKTSDANYVQEVIRDVQKSIDILA